MLAGPNPKKRKLNQEESMVDANQTSKTSALQAEND